MEYEFVIPIKKEDLLSREESQYCAQKIELSKAWKEFSDFKKGISAKGCEAISEHFDVVFSILYESQDASFGQLQELWECAIHPLLEDLRRFVQEALKDLSLERRSYYLNVLQMNAYIISLFIKTYEDKLSYNADNFIADKKGKGGKGKGKTCKYDTLWDWNSSKKVAFSLIYGILEENLNNMWDPPIADEQFVNLIANCCYKAFENPEISQAKLKPLKDIISQVLGILVATYNHGLLFVSRCIEFLKEHEHAAVALAGAIQTMVIDYKSPTVLYKVLKEATEIARDEDLQGFGKAVATFLTNICETNPQILTPCIKLITICLAFEPYILRNAVLISFCELVLKCYSSDSLSNEDKKTRDTLLKYLHNHMRDQNAFVRSKVLQLWAKLATSHAIPIDTLMPVLRTAKARLSDSSSHVVKNAIQLFMVILKNNIYAGKFNLSELQAQLSKAKENLKGQQSKQVLLKDQVWNHIEADLVIHLSRKMEEQMEEETDNVPESEGVTVEETTLIIAQLLQKRFFGEALKLLKTCEVQFPDSREIRCNRDRTDEVEYYVAVFKKIFLNSTPNFNPQAEEYEKQELVVNYLEDTVAFAVLISEAAKEIELPLYRQSSMEAVEAIEFFKTAYQFSAADSKRVVKEMIILIWSKTPGIKEAVAEAYKSLYIESSQPTPKGKALQAAKRLTKLLKEMDHDQKAALQELIHLWHKNNDISKEFIQVLWEIFSMKLSQFNEEDSTAALIFLDILSEKTPLIVSYNLQVLVDCGLVESKPLLLIEYCCEMISKLPYNKGDNGKPMRLSPQHEVFKKISEIIIKKFPETPLDGYMAMCSAALKMIYKTCSKPLKVSNKLLKNLYQILVEDSKQKKKEGEDSNNGIAYTEAMLSSLFYIFGDSAFRKWQYFDRDVFNAFKKQIHIQAKMDQSSLEDEFETENQEAANDALVASINEVCEKCLDVKGSLDLYLKEFIEKMCLNIATSNKINSLELQTTAVTALIKIMMVSSAYCENNIQVLVTIMEKATIESVRSNAVLGFGDLVVRFPNILDPWTNHLYGRLKDSSAIVRGHTVVVLSHLISREMIKVRGQIAELCLSMEDPEPEIQNRVRILLKNLSQKGNSLYNVIPDIISHLSNPDREDALSTVSFNRILKFVLGLMGKERQNDMLVEKLCVRLKESTNETQWKQLSFCLSQLTYSEKSLRKLIECLSTLNDRLFCQDVYSAIEGIFVAASKSHFTKPQYKEIATEGLSKLEEIISGRDGSAGTTQIEKSKKKDEDDDAFMEPVTPRVPHSERRVPRSTTRSTRKMDRKAERPVPDTPRSTRTRQKRQ